MLMSKYRISFRRPFFVQTRKHVFLRFRAAVHFFRKRESKYLGWVFKCSRLFLSELVKPVRRPSLGQWENIAWNMRPQDIRTMLTASPHAASASEAAFKARSYLYIGDSISARRCLAEAEKDEQLLPSAPRHALMAVRAYLAYFENNEEMFARWAQDIDAPAWAKNALRISAVREYACSCVEFIGSMHNSEMRPQLAVKDQCPCCGYEYTFYSKGPRLPWSGFPDDRWLCPRCLAQRTWDKDLAKADALAFFQEYTARLPEKNHRLTPASEQLASILAQSLTPVACVRIGGPLMLTGHPAIGHYVFDISLYLLARLNRMAGQCLEYVDYATGEPTSCVTRVWDRVFAFLRHDPAMHGVIGGKNAARVSRTPIFFHQNRVELALARDEHNILQRGDLPWPLTAEEMAEGNKNVRRMGIPPHAKIACLMVRDGAYDKQTRPESKVTYPHRNADINTYRPAMEFLAEQGWYVLRMGASVEKPIYWKSPRIIDYASEHRSPFMDVWLVSQCHLAISTGLGLDAIPTILKKPLIYTNMPFLYWPHGNYAPLLILHKHFYHSASRVALTRLDVMRSHHAEVFFDKDFHDANLSVLNNTAGEILEITKEMLEIIDGKHTLSPEDIRCQKHFWETLAAYVTSFPNYAPLYRLGRESLRRDPDFSAASLERTATLAPGTPLPWNAAPVPKWEASSEMLQAAYAEAISTDNMHIRETLLLCLLWAKPGHAEAGWQLSNLYSKQDRKAEALFFAAHAAFFGKKEPYYERCATLRAEISDIVVPGDLPTDSPAALELMAKNDTLNIDGNILQRVFSGAKTTNELI